jgi:hypothetical protein
MSNLTVDEDNPLQMLLYGLRAPESKRQYPRRLKVFLDYLTNKGGLTSNVLETQCKEFVSKTRENPKWTNNQLMEFVLYQKERVERREIVATTIRNYLKATKLLLEMNFDIPVINWKRITKTLPAPRNASSDRAPTLEEIKKLLSYPDRRIKPIILCMLSGGFRIGSWDYLKWKHVIPINNEKTGRIMAARTIIYSEESEEYYCFITPEAYDALTEWMDFRKNSGEDITGDSWLMRDIWSTTDFDTFKNSTLGLVKYPKPLKSSGIKSLIERAMRAQGLAKPLINGVKRREWKSGHGYRKFFKTKAEQVMKPANVELLSGRSIGISQSYYKPTSHDLVQDYLKAIPLLTINDEYRLRSENEKLKDKQKDNEYIIRGKIADKEKEIILLKQREEINSELIGNLSDKLTRMDLDLTILKRSKFDSSRNRNEFTS